MGRMSRWGRTATLILGLALLVALVAAPSVGMAATVQGTVTNSASSPLGGIHVSISTPNSWDWAEAVTSAGGTYTLDVPLVGQYSVSVNDPTGVFLTEFRYPVNVTALPVTADFTMLRPGGFTGIVSDAANPLIRIQEIEVQSLRLSGDFEYWDGTAYTDQNGEYAISGANPGPHAVYFVDTSSRTTPYAPQWFNSVTLFSAATTVMVLEDANTPNINAALSNDSVLGGRVTDAVSGVPLGSTIVTLQEESGFDLVWTSTGADGTYRVAGSPAGTYTVTVYSPQDDYVNIDRVVVLANNQVLTNVDFAMAPTATGYLIGRVIDSLAAPVGGIEVSLASGLPSANNPVEFSTVTTASGGFLLPPRTGPITLKFFDTTGAHPEFVATAVVAGPGVLTDFILASAGTISSTVVDSAGTPLAGVFVRLWDAAAPAAPLDSATTGLDGSYNFGELPVGSYRVSFDADTYQPEYYDNAQTFLGSSIIAVASNAGTADAVLSRPDTLSGTVTDIASLPSVGTLVEIWHVGPSGLELSGLATTDLTGGFSVGSLVSGDYLVRLSAGLGAGYVIPGGQRLTTFDTLGARYTFADSLTPQTQAISVRYAFDTVDPAVLIGVTSTTSFGTWHSSPATATLSATAVGGSGVDQTFYQIDGLTPVVYTAPFPISVEGPHTVTYWATDLVGNESTHVDQAVDIDVTAPVVSVTVASDQTSANWHSAPTTVTVSVVETASGIASTFYSIDGLPPVAYTGPFTISSDGPHTITAWATDNVGNLSATASHAADIDAVAPVVDQVVFTADQNILDWYSSPTTVTLSAVDVVGGSGLAQILYILDGSPAVYGAPFAITASGSHTIEYWAVDNVGNAAVHQTATIFVGSIVSAVSGTVTDGAAALPGMHVVIQGVNLSAPFWAETATLADGTYSFDVSQPGTYTVRVDDPNGDFAAQQRLVTVATGVTSVVDFVLGAHGSISGTVTDASTFQPIQLIDVWSMRLGGDFEYWDGWTLTDPYGVYTLGSTDPGPHAVYFSDGSERAVPYAAQWFDGVADLALATTVTVIPGAPTTGIDAAMVAGTSISGTVTDSVTGTPLGGIVIQVQDALGFDLVWTSTAADGTYRATGLPFSTYDVLAQSATGDHTDATVTGVVLDALTTSQVVDFALVPADGHLTGRAVDTSTTPVPDIEVRLAMGVPADNNPVEFTTLTAGNGTFALPSRTATITLTFFDPSGAYSTLVTTTASAGPADLGDFILGATGTISGSVLDVNGAALAGTVVRLWDAAGSVAPLDSAIVGLAGTYSFGDLAAGSYKVSFDSDGYQPEWFDNQFTFASATVITVTDSAVTADAVLSPAATISGNITTFTDGPAVGATVRALRLVTGGPDLAGTAVTGVNGDYTISGLLPGDYVVQLEGLGIVGYVQTDRQWLTSALANAEVFPIPDSLTPFTVTVDARLAIDETPPVVTIALDAAQTFGIWYSSPVTVSIVATDPPSGVADVFYQLDGGAVTTYTAPFDVTGNGPHTVSAFARDTLGNESAPVVSAFSIDTVDPEVFATVDPPAVDGWFPATSVTLSATDDGSSVADIFYTVNGGAVTAYTAPIALTATDRYDISYWAVDNVANASDHETLSLDVDTDDPTVPGDLHWTSIHPTSVRLAWSASSDADSGFDFYEVYADGVLLDTMTNLFYVATGLTPNTSIQFTVTAVDVVGNRSDAAVLDVTTPASEFEAQVPTGTDVSETIDVPFNGTIKPFVFLFDQVTTAGTLTVTPLGSKPPFADVPAGLRTVGGYYDVSFTGTFTGSVRVTLPYDDRLPNFRAMTLQLLRWLDGSSPDVIDVTVNTTAHTVTFTLTSLSPIVLAEPETNDAATDLPASWRGTTATTVSPAFSARITLIGLLHASDGSPLYRGAVVDVQQLIGGEWQTIGQTTRESSGLYVRLIKVYTLGVYRLSFAGDPVNDASVSRELTVKPHFRLSLSSLKSSYSHRSSFTVRGTISPRQRVGSRSTVYVKLYRYRNGHWRIYQTVAAKIGSMGTTFSASVRLRTTGRWKLVPYAPTNGLNTSTTGRSRYTRSR